MTLEFKFRGKNSAALAMGLEVSCLLASRSFAAAEMKDWRRPPGHRWLAFVHVSRL